MSSADPLPSPDSTGRSARTTPARSDPAAAAGQPGARGGFASEMQQALSAQVAPTSAAGETAAAPAAPLSGSPVSASPESAAITAPAAEAALTNLVPAGSGQETLARTAAGLQRKVGSTPGAAKSTGDTPEAGTAPLKTDEAFTVTQEGPAAAIPAVVQPATATLPAAATESQAHGTTAAGMPGQVADETAAGPVSGRSSRPAPDEVRADGKETAVHQGTSLQPADAAAAPEPAQTAAGPSSPMAPPPLATPALPPPTNPAVTDAPAPAAPPASAQLAAAIAEPVQVTVAAPSAPGAAQILTIHLKPVELGRVEVRIERSAEGPTKIELAVERTDTLLMLIRDQPQLHQALDQAGVPPDGRTVHFSLAADQPATGSGSSLLGDGATGSGGGSGQRSPYHGSGDRGGPDAGPGGAYPVWTRSGIDITA